MLLVRCLDRARFGAAFRNDGSKAGGLRSVALPEVNQPPDEHREQRAAEIDVAPAIRGQQQATHGFYHHVADEIIRGPDPHNGAALMRPEPFGDAAHATGPAGGLSKPVDEHKGQESPVRVGEAKDEIDNYRNAQAAEQQHARSPSTANQAAQELTDHVCEEKRSPKMCDLADANAKMVRQRRLANRENFPREVIACIGEVS